MYDNNNMIYNDAATGCNMRIKTRLASNHMSAIAAIGADDDDRNL